jgi:hypothetical protein
MSTEIVAILAILTLPRGLRPGRYKQSGGGLARGLTSCTAVNSKEFLLLGACLNSSQVLVFSGLAQASLLASSILGPAWIVVQLMSLTSLGDELKLFPG